MANNIVQLIENICNANAMANTWMMWAERALPDQRTYSISVYQQRDAFSHIATMFANGFSDGYLSVEEGKQDFNGFFADSQVEKQLDDTYAHVTRAFFDCADFIFMHLRDVCKIDPERYRFLSFCLNRYSKEVDALRRSKSESDSDIFKRMEHWDSLLHAFSVAYELAEFHAQLLNTHNRVLAILSRIETEYSRDLIIRCCPKFFEESTNIQTQNKQFLSEFDVLFAEEGKLLPETPVSPSDISRSWADKIEAIIRENETYLVKCNSLYDSMKIHDDVENRKSTRDSISKMISSVVAPLAAIVVGGAFNLLSKPVDSTQQGVSIVAFVIGFVVFIAGQIIAIFVGRRNK